MNIRPIKIVCSSILMLSTFIMGSKIISFEEPKFSLENYQIENGFELSLIASEPFMKAPTRKH